MEVSLLFVETKKYSILAKQNFKMNQITAIGFLHWLLLPFILPGIDFVFD